MVYRRKLVSRTTFRNLPFGAMFWTTTTFGTTAPYIKLGRRNIVLSFSTDAVVGGTVLDTSIAAINVPKPFLQYDGVSP